MRHQPPERPYPDVLSSRKLLAEQAFSRAAGAPLVPGNRIDLLKDARDNYPAWITAIESASETIHLEMYLVHNDEIGRQWVDLLAARARDGVHVRVLYDWLGAFGNRSSPRRLWQPLRQAGGEVRSCNPPRFDNLLGWFSRNHRKMLSVDGREAFVSGLCIGQYWIGQPEKGIAPWRDTGVRLRGPVVADLERVFARSWTLWGTPIPADERPSPTVLKPAGHQELRVIAGSPETAGMYRLDLLIAAIARHTLWLTDPYFVGTRTYLQALSAAAQSGVDVRLLVPGGSDLKLVSMLSRTLYRPLLQSGIRVFEWNGSMLHAKTAVVDGCWARVGSSNLNIASWLGNWELDVAVEDETFAREMEEMYLEDLEQATELVLTSRKRVRSIEDSATGDRSDRLGPLFRQNIVAGAFVVGGAISAGATHFRPVGPAASGALTTVAMLLLGLSALILFFPRIAAIPIAVLGIWIAIIFFIRARKLRLEDRSDTSL